MTDANHTAFPAEHEANGSGLTKREYFAAMAMKGLINESGIDSCATEEEWIAINWIAKSAVLMADVLIDELNK